VYGTLLEVSQEELSRKQIKNGKNKGLVSHQGNVSHHKKMMNHNSNKQNLFIHQF
jgi:hypothetical protein